MGAWARRVCLAALLGTVSLRLSAVTALAAQVSRPVDRVPGQALVRLSGSLSQAVRRDLLTGHGLSRVCSIPELDIELVTPTAAPASEEGLAGLAESAPAQWAEPNYLCWVALAEPNDPAYHELANGLWVQWPAHQLEALAAWDIYPGWFFDASQRPQEGPIVAVVDTGIDPSHPDFMNPGATSAEVSDGGQLMLSAARTFLAGQPDDGQPGARDEHGHGTHLAGLVAAAANNGVTAGDGIAGIGYPARLLPLKVAGANGVATHADMARAILYAADQGASVILTGMSGETWSRTLQAAVDYAWERGCLVVAPAGNTGDETPTFPAGCPHVLGVAAGTAWGEVAAYSTRGQAGLTGPGGDETVGVYSTFPTYACKLRTDLTTPAYGWLFGTSQAAAHVAGAAALYAGETGLAPETGDEAALIWAALEESATALAGSISGGWEGSGGYGLVAPVSLLTGACPREATVGGIVGRVLLNGDPVLGAEVTATREGAGDPATATSQWPAGGYRMANLPPGRYRVTTEVEGSAGIWERARVGPGHDAPGVDFRPGGPLASAELVSAEIARAAVRGRTAEVQATFRNTGAGSWTRGEGFQMVQAASDRPLCEEPDHVNLGLGEVVAPGGSATFSVSLPAPDDWGFYTTAWRMSQQGGVGWFGPTVSGAISVTSFLDVMADHWAVAEIEAARQAGVIQGYEGYLYHPEWPVSRDQMAVFISRALAGGDEYVPTSPAQVSFPDDVPSTHWAYKYIEYAVSRGVVAGYDSTHYRPELVVDRGQMCVFIARALGWVKLGDAMDTAPQLFSDVPAGFWAGTAIEACVDNGVVQGYDDGTYRPSAAVTRDQMAVYVARAFGLPM